MTDTDDEGYGYKSAMDMPSFVEMQKQMDGFQLLKFLLKKEDREKVTALGVEMVALAKTVDSFYDLLGDRQWIFHDRLPLAVLRERVLSQRDATAAERELCTIYEDPERMKFMVGSVMRFPEMRAREGLVTKAQLDFEEGRYYSTVLILLTVMDGFVNDVHSVRRGLHAREAGDLETWDSPVGHHRGLTSTQASFRKSYTKRVDVEFHDLARNGILHGNITNFDNVIIASKAWNRLLAVVDWATSLEKAAKPKKPEPTWSEVMERVKENADFKSKMNAWKPSSGSVLSADEPAAHSSVKAAAEFLDLWARSNWGHLALRFMRLGKEDSGKATPQEIRSSFAPYPLEAFTIRAYEVQAPAIAEVMVDVQVAEQVFPVVLRMTFVDEDGGTRVEGQQKGSWKMVWRSPELFNRELARVAKL